MFLSQGMYGGLHVGPNRTCTRFSQTMGTETASHLLATALSAHSFSLLNSEAFLVTAVGMGSEGVYGKANLHCQLFWGLVLHGNISGVVYENVSRKV